MLTIQSINISGIDSVHTWTSITLSQEFCLSASITIAIRSQDVRARGISERTYPTVC